MPLDDCGGDSGKLWKEMKDGSCCCSERHQLIFIRAIVEFLAPTIARYLMMLNTCVTQRELIESPPQSSHTLEDINEWCCCLRFKQTLIKLTMCYYRPNIRSELLLHLMQLSPAVLVPIIRIIGERLWGQTKVRLGNSEMKDGSCCCSERHQLIFIRAIVEFLAPTIARYLMMLNTCVTQRELIESPPQSSHTLEDINEWCCCLRFKQTLIKLTMCYYRPNIRSELLLHLMQLSPAVLVPIIRIIGERLWGQTKVRLGNSEMKDGSCCCSATNDQLVSSLPQNFSHQNLCPHNEPSFPITAQCRFNQYFRG